jgi:four helix bundle protein
MSKVEFIESLKRRTRGFALAVIKLVSSLPNSKESLVITKQLLRSATSVGANYRAATRARSQGEFFSKISIVVEEADECLYWLELLEESEIVQKEKIVPLYAECEEILKIVSTARKTISTK